MDLAILDFLNPNGYGVVNQKSKMLGNSNLNESTKRQTMASRFDEVDWRSLVPHWVKFSSSKPRPVAAGDFDVFFERGFFRASQVAMSDFICILKNRHA
jgi:hypothetical protein